MAHNFSTKSQSPEFVLGPRIPGSGTFCRSVNKSLLFDIVLFVSVIVLDTFCIDNLMRKCVAAPNLELSLYHLCWSHLININLQIDVFLLVTSTFILYTSFFLYFLSLIHLEWYWFLWWVFCLAIKKKVFDFWTSWLFWFFKFRLHIKLC